MENLFAFMRRALDSGGLATLRGQPVLNVRKRFTVAEINAGATLVAAPGLEFAIRPVNYKMIAVGGNAATATDVRVLGTRAGSGVALLITTVGALTRSAVNYPGVANNTVLADGASYAQLDENTAVTVGKTGGTLDTATHVDVIFDYCVDKL